MNFKDFLDPVTIAWAGLVLFTGVRALRSGSGGRKRLILPAAVSVLLPGLELVQLPERLMASLESAALATAGTIPSRADAVMVCGGVLHVSPGEVTGADYNSSVDRLLTGAVLARSLHCPLVWGGAPGEFEALQRLLAAGCFPDVDFRGYGPCRDTREESVRAAAMAKAEGWDEVVLVTSAWHLPRAGAAFRRAGLPVIPVGCDFSGTAGLADGHPRFLPSSGSLSTLHFWLCESIGRVYYRLRGWI